MRIEKFEDIKAWQEAKQLVLLVYGLTRKPKFARDFGLKDQIQRAAVSGMNNIAEGFERQGNAEFSKFLYYAKGSVGEVRSLLYIAKDLGYISDAEFKRVYDQCVKVSRLISNFISYLRQTF
jgi:four helix bundle protein